MGQAGDLIVFQEYLRSLPQELLESVSEDYIWLAGLEFEPERLEEFRRRRECCREECTRRGVPGLYRMALSEITPWAA